MKETAFGILAYTLFFSGFGMVLLGSWGAFNNAVRYYTALNECLFSIGPAGGCSSLADYQTGLALWSGILVLGGMLFFAGVVFVATNFLILHLKD